MTVTELNRLQKLENVGLNVLGRNAICSLFQDFEKIVVSVLKNEEETALTFKCFSQLDDVMMLNHA